MNNEPPATAEKPAAPVPAKRIPVMIATPLKNFNHTAADLDRQCPQIGRAMRELAERKDEHCYEFEFAAACGGLCSARNRLVHDFLHKSDCQILKWWDADLYDQAGKDAEQQGTANDKPLHSILRGPPVGGHSTLRRSKYPTAPACRQGRFVLRIIALALVLLRWRSFLCGSASAYCAGARSCVGRPAPTALALVLVWVGQRLLRWRSRQA